MSKIIDLLKQPSTWKGVIIILSLVGINSVNLTPEQIGKVVESGLSLYAAIAIFWQKS